MVSYKPIVSDIEEHLKIKKNFKELHPKLIDLIILTLVCEKRDQ